MRTHVPRGLVLLCCLASGGLAAVPPQSDEPCNRSCLEGFADLYLDALVAHDPSLLSLTLDVKLTENGQQLEIGDGLWRSMVGKGSYRLLVADVPAGQVAFIGTIREESNTAEEGSPSVLALRLKIENRQIAEIETFVVTNQMAARNLERRGGPPPVLLETVPESRRMSREDLIRVANMYFSGMQQNDGKGEYPFADDCNRIDNGRQTTNVATTPGETRPDPSTARNYSSQWSCREQFESGLLHFVTRIRDRRFVAVDVERGLVFSFVFFDHSGGDTRTFQTPNGRTMTAGPVDPWTWEIAEMFKVENGLIRQIESILERVPYGMLSGWSSWEAGMSSRAQDVTGYAEN
jgi:hypothetical protein